jgi:O-antigen/teichoic acid export membrane protein
LYNLFSTVIRNSFFGGFGKLSVKAISFAFTIFIVRWLGDEGYGQYTLIWSYVTVFAMLSDAGLGMYAIREIAKKQPGSQYIAGNVIIIRLILATLTIALTIIIVWGQGYSGRFLWNVGLASAVLLLYAVQDPLDALLQAYERFDISAAAIMAGQLAFVGAGVVLLLLDWRVTGLIVAGLLSVLVSMLLAWRWLVGQQPALLWRLEPALWFDFVRASFPFGLIKLWLSWSLKLDIVILSWFWPHQMVGWYSAAYAVVVGLMVISNSINTAFYPTLSRQYAEDPASVSKVYELALKYMLLISLPIAGTIFLMAGQVTYLLYGPGFTLATSALTILIWVLPVTFISEFLRYILLITNRERVVVRALGLAVLFAVGLNLWLIPRYGFLATAMVVVAAEALLVLLYTRRLYVELKAINLYRVLLKPLLATALSMLVIYLLAPFPVFWQLVLSGSVYIFLIWLLRVIQPDEYQLLFYLVTRYQEKLTSLIYHEKSSPDMSTH